MPRQHAQGWRVGSTWLVELLGEMVGLRGVGDRGIFMCWRVREGCAAPRRMTAITCESCRAASQGGGRRRPALSPLSDPGRSAMSVPGAGPSSDERTRGCGCVGGAAEDQPRPGRSARAPARREEVRMASVGGVALGFSACGLALSFWGVTIARRLGGRDAISAMPPRQNTFRAAIVSVSSRLTGAQRPWHGL